MVGIEDGRGARPPSRTGGGRARRLGAFELANPLLMVLVCFCTLYPFLFIVTSSLSANNASTGGLSLFPRELTLDNYTRVLGDPLIFSGFKNTVLRTLLGTALSLLAIFSLAYPLSKRNLPNRSFWTGLVVFTLFFSGGQIPTYLLVRSLGLIDSVWALVLPELISAYYMVIVRNYMQAIPSSLEESAKIDGANDVVIFFKIVLPICKPIIATVALWVAVSHWNAWFDCMIYITKPAGEVLQLVMRHIVIQGSDQLTEMMSQVTQEGRFATPEGLKSATIIVTTLPILCVYPFLQKYFVKGVMVGSLKG